MRRPQFTLLRLLILTSVQSALTAILIHLNRSTAWITVPMAIAAATAFFFLAHGEQSRLRRAADLTLMAAWATLVVSMFLPASNTYGTAGTAAGTPVSLWRYIVMSVIDESLYLLALLLASGGTQRFPLAPLIGLTVPLLTVLVITAPVLMGTKKNALRVAVAAMALCILQFFIPSDVMGEPFIGYGERFIGYHLWAASALAASIAASLRYIEHRRMQKT